MSQTTYILVYRRYGEFQAHIPASATTGRRSATPRRCRRTSSRTALTWRSSSTASSPSTATIGGTPVDQGGGDTKSVGEIGYFNKNNYFTVTKEQAE